MDWPRHRIPRKEVEQIAGTVMNELEIIQPGCSHMIVGGCVDLKCDGVDPDRHCLHSYRRGKPQSNDIDIVITHTKADQRKNQELCQELTDVLSKKGLVTHLMSDSGSPYYNHIIQHSRGTQIQHSPVKTHQRHRMQTSLRRLSQYSPFLVPKGAADWT